MTEPTEEDVEQFIIFAGYGEVMHRFQMLELALWGLLSANLNPRITVGQGMAKVAKWNGTTFGSLMRGIKNQPHWPPDLLAKLMGSVDVRNYMSHHFLREYFIAQRSQANRETATQELANLANWLDDLSDELDAHLETQGVIRADLDDEQTAAEIEALRPKDWFFMDVEFSDED